MNKVFLIGNLTRDPELSETSNGVSVCRITIAVNRMFKKEDGTTETDFFNITIWRTLAENCGRYLKKGSKVAVVGSLQNRSYDDKDGLKRYVTDIMASDVEFLTPKNNSEDDGSNIPPRNQTQTQTKMKGTAPTPTLEPIDDDQLPF